jgi:hypothetical protein
VIDAVPMQDIMYDKSYCGKSPHGSHGACVAHGCTNAKVSNTARTRKWSEMNRPLRVNFRIFIKVAVANACEAARGRVAGYSPAIPYAG